MEPKKRSLGAGERDEFLRAAWRLLVDKGSRVKEIIEDRGCDLLYLPPYSPDFNPIEQAYSKVKGLLRRAQARTRESLIEAMGRALEAVSARDAQGFFGHCGYRSLDQLLCQALYYIGI